jgi:hypothetical protein
VIRDVPPFLSNIDCAYSSILLNLSQFPSGFGTLSLDLQYIFADQVLPNDLKRKALSYIEPFQKRMHKQDITQRFVCGLCHENCDDGLKLRVTKLMFTTIDHPSSLGWIHLVHTLLSRRKHHKSPLDSVGYIIDRGLLTIGSIGLYLDRISIIINKSSTTWL